ncbi:MAG TPA: trypsin-like peptidase domain-containing protein [Mycobacteriales bacterium]|nr:trypsin-like peptidase domain-containing protein [Mycobacteriales bacterium]
MGGVFVNYRTGDGEWAARLTAEKLSAQIGADQVFYASRSIPPGDDFARDIEQRLAGSDILLAMVGHQWLQIADRSGKRRLDNPDDWVRQEIRSAFAHGLRVIPVLLDGADRLVDSDLPDDIAALAHRQYLRMHHRDERDVARLVDEVRRLLPAPLGERWRVRIRTGGAVLGAGVLLGGQYVLTCAHVVAEAGELVADLTGLPGVPSIAARVVPEYCVPARDDQRGDLALLRLDRRPAGAVGATLRREALNWDRDVHVCGFPRGLEDGVYIRATLAGASGPGGEWVQMNPRSPGEPRVRAGFSGAGVVDHRTGHVLGIVVGQATDPAEPLFWMIPVETILSHIPRIAEWVAGDPVDLEPAAAPVPGGRDQDLFVRGFVEWLNRRDAGDRIMIIVGQQVGSMRATVAQSSRQRRSIAADPAEPARPAPGSVDVAVDVSGRTVEEVSRRILDRAGIPPDAAASATEQIRAGVPPMTIVLDGIDQAAEPAQLLTELVKPLADGGSRLALGFWNGDSPSLDVARSWDLDTVGSRLRRLAERLGTLEAAERELSRLRIEIRGPAPVPGEAAVLAVPLDDLERRREDPEQDLVRSDLGRLEQKVAHVLRQTTRAVAQLTEGLEERRNLRRRLDADKANASRAGLAEDAGLDAWYRQARELLWRKPVDIRAGHEAVLAYERELRRRRRGGIG